MFNAGFTQPTRRSGNSTRQSGHTLVVCVVDPQPDAYREWPHAAGESRLRLLIVANAAEALWLARSEKIDLWVVNTTLPGLSGCELCSMLRSRDRRNAVCLVADHHAPEIEQAAWAARATMFGVKDEASTLIRHWVEHISGGSQTSAFSAKRR